MLRKAYVHKQARQRIRRRAVNDKKHTLRKKQESRDSHAEDIMRRARDNADRVFRRAGIQGARTGDRISIFIRKGGRDLGPSSFF